MLLTNSPWRRNDTTNEQSKSPLVTVTLTALFSSLQTLSTSQSLLWMERSSSAERSASPPPPPHQPITAILTSRGMCYCQVVKHSSPYVILQCTTRLFGTFKITLKRLFKLIVRIIMCKNLTLHARKRPKMYFLVFLS